MLQRARCDMLKKVYKTIIPDQFHMEFSSLKLFPAFYTYLCVTSRG